MATTITTAQGMFSSEPSLGRQRGLWSDAWRRLLKNRFAVVSMVLLTVICAVAFVGAFHGPLARYEANEQNYAPELKQQGPTRDHWFGTDQLGRDQFARVLEGIRISVQIGLGTQLVVLCTGLLIGSFAAFGGKWSDNLLMRFTDVMFSFPDILLIILVRAVLFGRDIFFITNPKVMIIAAISLTAWTTIARLVRGQMLSLAERDYVLAARSLGASKLSIVFQHMLPNTLGPVIVAVTFGIPAAIFAEAALGFIGLGIPPPTVSLGYLVSSGYSTIQRNEWAVVFPALTIATLMLCFTFLGDGLRDALDPRTR
jgi:oligopeptide transport system permease protein